MDTIKEKIISVAKAFAKDQSWPWIDPVEVLPAQMPSGERAWSVRTNIHAKGRNVRLLIRESDLSVMESAYPPR